MKSWIKMGMLAGRIFYVKDMWARDVAALTFASFMAFDSIHGDDVCHCPRFRLYGLCWSRGYLPPFEAQPVVAQTIVNFVHNYIENTQSNYIIGTGIVMFLYTIISLMQKIELTFDDIWHTGEAFVEADCYGYPTILFGLGMMILFASFFNVWTVNVIDDVDRIADMGETIPAFHLACSCICADVPILRILLLRDSEYLYPVSQYAGAFASGGHQHDGIAVWIYLSAGIPFEL